MNPIERAQQRPVSRVYALRHLSDLAAAFAEFHRVLRPGGRLLMLEITRPQGRLATLALKTYMRAVVPTIARVLARRGKTSELWRYYWDTIEACVPARGGDRGPARGRLQARSALCGAGRLLGVHGVQAPLAPAAAS